MSLTPEQLAAAERMYNRSRRAFDDLVDRCRQLPAGTPAWSVADLANGIFAGAATTDPEGAVRVLQHLCGVVACAAYTRAHPGAPKTLNLADYTANEGGSGI